MKSIFSRLSTLLLCGAVAMVGCTDYSEDIQNLGTEVDNKIESLENELDALRKSVAETYATIEDLNDLADEVEAVNNAVDALEATVAEKADKADVEAKIDAVNDAIDDLKAKLDTKADKTALEAVEDRVTALENEVKALDAEKADITYVDGQVAALETLVDSYKTELDGKISNLTAKLDEEVAALEAEDKELQDQIDELKADVKDLKDAVEKKADKEYVDDEFVKIATQLSELAAADGRLKDQINTIITDLGKLTNRVAELETLYNALKKSTEEQIKALEDKKADKADVQGKIDALKESLDKLEKKYEDALKQIEELYTNKVDKATFESTIANLYDELSTVAALADQVPGLLARVQSLVYVPDYSDHKATIQWALVNNGIQALNLEETPAYTVLAKTSELKYLVKANTPADAESAAKAIVAAWEEVLDYAVEPVKIRTRAEEAVADLEIVGVTAKDDVVTVSVVAKNFDYEFFNNPEEGIYSAAIVLKDDKGNNLTSEYTNLVPGVAEEYQMALFVYEEDPQTADETLRMTGNDEVITYLISCNDTVTVKSAVKPIVGFVPVIDGVPAVTVPASFYTPELLAEEGYDVTVDMDITLVDTENHYVHDGMNDTKPGPITIDDYFNIEGGNPVYDFHYSVKPGVSFDNKGKYSTVTYTFTCGNTVQNLTYRIELANAQVAVNIETDHEWSIALQDALNDGEIDEPNDGKNDYARNNIIPEVPFEAVGGPVAHLTPVLNAPAVMKEGYPKFYVKDAEGEWVEVEKRSFELSAFNDNATVDIRLLGGTYSWNNSYKIVWVSTNDNDHVDYTTTAIVNLVGRPEKIDVEIPVEFVLKGTNSWFEAPADLCGKAFEKLDEYLEYGDSATDKAKWESIFASIVEDYKTAPYDMPTVNGEKSNWIANLENLATAKLLIGKNKINEGKPNVITWSVTPWWGVPVNFTVTGNIVIPKYEFIYSEDYVKNATATVYGQIEEVKGDNETGATRVYNIIKSDLAKYFNVDAESLNGHNYTVEFEVVAPEATEDEYVTVGPETVTPVADKGNASYHYLTRDLAVLDWATYRGLKVEVKATLKINGFERETLPLTLVTEDPLTLTGEKEYTVNRELRDDIDIEVFQKLVLTSSVEKNLKNLLSKDMEKGTGVYATLAEAEAYAAGVYGADIKVVLGTKGVYYYDNSGELRILGANKYYYNEQTGVLTIYGDDAQVKNYYADFTAVMTSRICGGEHQVPFRVVATLKK